MKFLCQPIGFVANYKVNFLMITSRFKPYVAFTSTCLKISRRAVKA